MCTLSGSLVSRTPPWGKGPQLRLIAHDSTIFPYSGCDPPHPPQHPGFALQVPWFPPPQALFYSWKTLLSALMSPSLVTPSHPILILLAPLNSDFTLMLMLLLTSIPPCFQNPGQAQVARPIIRKDIDSLIKYLLVKKIPGPHGGLYQTFKEDFLRRIAVS